MDLPVRALQAFLFSVSPSLTADKTLRTRKGPVIAWLFATKILSSALIAVLAPVREALTMTGGKHLQSRLMLGSTLVAVVGQAAVASYCSRYGAMQVYRGMYLLSAVLSLLMYASLRLQHYTEPAAAVFFLYHSFFNMSCVSLYWSVASDVLAQDSVRVFGAISAGGEQ
jgi:hypothetical protein